MKKKMNNKIKIKIIKQINNKKHNHRKSKIV